ncbi:protein yippee-like 3 isoform X1 [Xyrauchen texanus]|uniref:protein yippee-like 3 isoform X1 n=2 Tax=Xyrauchen texanus TaxID=154827 RepID=UPI0022421D2F|nr:protein yippee-like 3 isoform X1 [Xyrauchen texanus]
MTVCQSCYVLLLLSSSKLLISYSLCCFVVMVKFRHNRRGAGVVILACLVYFCLCVVFKDMVKQTKAKTFQAYLDSCHRRYSCVHCRAHLANHDDLISKSFQGSQGRAYLFNSVVNIGCGPAEERLLLTGLHAVADIYCENCHTTLGWKYEQAFELSQKYKEGKFIIELSHMIKDNGWD